MHILDVIHTKASNYCFSKTMLNQIYNYTNNNNNSYNNTFTNNNDNTYILI